MPFFLDAANLPALTAHMQELGWLSDAETILQAGSAGEGNMNCTLRVRTNTRSVIVKQSRAWVEKYPQIPAPENRILVEGAFYQTVHSPFLPQLLGFHPPSRLLMLEDLAPARDFTFMYCGNPPITSHLLELVRFLEQLHRVHAAGSVFENHDMRRLNHEHIFHLPLQPANGLGYDHLAQPLWSDSAYCDRVRTLGDLYLANGPSLVHGDYFPGSWLNTSNGPKVIDLEFCFYGPPEFDLGVMLAHLHLSRNDFDPIAHYQHPCNATLARQFAGVEIMRRLIGVAQLPLTRTLEENRAALDQSRQWVLA